MTSAFMYYGTNDEVLKYLKNSLNNEYHSMIDEMTPEWRNATVYVLSRSKYQLYLNALHKGYEAKILNRVDPASVLYGSGPFTEEIDQQCA